MTGPDISQTTNTFAQQSILASSKAMVARLNADEQIRFDGRVSDYNANMQSGQKHDPPLIVPVAPKSWVVLPPNQDGYQFYDQTGPELSPTPPLTIAMTDLGTLTPPNNPPGTMVLGILIPGTAGIYQALKGDTCVEGAVKTIPGPDGGLLRLRKHGTPWGGYWETTIQ